MINLLISEVMQILNTIRPHDRLVVKDYDNDTDSLVLQCSKTGVPKVLSLSKSLFLIHSTGCGHVELQLLSSNQILRIPLEMIVKIREISKTDSYNEQKLFEITTSSPIKFSRIRFFEQFVNARYR